MKKISTAGARQTRNFRDQELTIGLGLGDRWSWYFVLNEAGEVVVEQKVATTPKAMKEVFGAMSRSRIALETWMHSPWVERVGTRSDRGACAQSAFDRGESAER
jgi:transposase